MPEFLPDPAALVAALQAADFAVAGMRSNAYIRWQSPGTGVPLLSPLDPTAPEYAELMDATMTTLRRLATDGARAQRVLDAVAPKPRFQGPADIVHTRTVPQFDAWWERPPGAEPETEAHRG